MKRHCDNCKFSYRAINFSGEDIGQHCNNSEYNSSDYTNKMLHEDWDKGHCRFWEEKKKDK